MAGIEKLCEFSGNACGCDMYTWKRDHIQVIPKYRREFKGKPCVLFIDHDPELCEFSDSSPSPFHRIKVGKLRFYLPRFWSPYYWTWRGVRAPLYSDPYKVWTYMLYTADPALQGQVHGEYYNSTTSPLRAIKNIRKMVGKDSVTILPTIDIERELRRVGRTK
jgi:hypothetical protein